MKPQLSTFLSHNIFYEKFYDTGLILPSGRIFQISEISLMPGVSVSPHTQWCDEITYAISGSATVICDDKEEKIQAGQLHFVKKDCFHEIIADSDENFRYFCLGFLLSPETDSRSEYSKALGSETQLVFDDDFSIRKILGLLLDEFYEWDSKSEHMASSYLEQIAISLSRQFSGKEKIQRPAPGQKPSANYTVYKIIRYIDRNFIQLTSVKEVAKDLNYSEYYISHLFSEKTGMNIKEYLTRKKVGYACELLMTSELDLERISEQLGFASSHSFRRIFKQYIGVSPSEYRKKGM